MGGSVSGRRQRGSLSEDSDVVLTLKSRRLRRLLFCSETPRLSGTTCISRCLLRLVENLGYFFSNAPDMNPSFTSAVLRLSGGFAEDVQTPDLDLPFDNMLHEQCSGGKGTEGLHNPLLRLQEERPQRVDVGSDYT